MLQSSSFFESLRSIARLGVPLRRFVLPNAIMIALEIVSLYLLAQLVSGVLSTAAGAAIDVRGALVLAVLLIAKSVLNGLLTGYIYLNYVKNEVELRRHYLNLARMASSRQLRERSVETVTHEVNVYPANLTYGVYQQAVKLISDVAIASAIIIALIVRNSGLTTIVLLLFAAISYVIAHLLIRITSRAGRISDEKTIRLVNFVGRYLGGRNEIGGSPIEQSFESDIDLTNSALSRAHAEINYVALVPRFAFDAIIGIGIFVVVGSVAAGWAELNQQDLAFSLAAGLKLAPYLTSIIGGILQISFSRAVVDGFRSSTAAISMAPESYNSLRVRMTPAAGELRLEVKTGELSTVVTKGEILLIKGRSGSGKTTIAELISDVANGRIVPPDSDSGRARGPTIAYSSQFATVLNKSLQDNIAHNVRDGSRVQTLIQRYGLEHLQHQGELNENTLSGGERQRIGIVRALNQMSEITVFDEPTASIGALYAEKVRQDVLDLAQRDTLVIVISHESTFDDIAHRRIDLT